MGERKEAENIDRYQTTPYNKDGKTISLKYPNTRRNLEKKFFLKDAKETFFICRYRS
jgi:hypothetical protein